MHTTSIRRPNDPMRLPATWVGVVLVWIGVIFFSSTSLAGRASDRALAFLVSTYVQRLGAAGLYHRWRLAFVAEKSVHLFMFLVFALLLWQTLPAFRGKALVIVACGAMLGCCSEVAQSFFPDRDPTVRDALINLTGTSLGVAFGYLCTRAQRSASRLKQR